MICNNISINKESAIDNIEVPVGTNIYSWRYGEYREYNEIIDGPITENYRYESSTGLYSFTVYSTITVSDGHISWGGNALSLTPDNYTAARGYWYRYSGNGIQAIGYIRDISYVRNSPTHYIFFFSKRYTYNPIGWVNIKGYVLHRDDTAYPNGCYLNGEYYQRGSSLALS